MMLGDTNDGLAARFAFFYPGPTPLTAGAGVDLEPALAAFCRIRGLPWTGPHPLALPFTEAAHDLHWKLRQEVRALEEDEEGVLLSWIGKMPGLCIRLAVTSSHMEWSWAGKGSPPSNVEEEEVRKAIRLLSAYLLPMARRTLRRASRYLPAGDAAILARWLLRRSPMPEVVNVRDLHRRPGGPAISTSERIAAALDELAACRWVRALKAKDWAQNRRQDWEVNPALRRRRR
jgi:hypothetical protein